MLNDYVNRCLPNHKAIYAMEEASLTLFDARLTVLLGALIFNALFAGPRSLGQALGFQRLALVPALLLKHLEYKLNRDRRSQDARKQRGRILALITLIAACALGVVMVVAASGPYGGLLEIMIVAALLSLRQTSDLALAIGAKLQDGSVAGARTELEGTPWRNAALLDSFGVARAAVETIAVNLCEKLVSPAVYYLLLGLPGLFVVRASALLADTVGHSQAGFGHVSTRIHYYLHYPVMLLSGLLVIAASAFLPFARPGRAFAQWLRHGVGGISMRRQVAVMGGALDLALGGPTSVYAQGEWIGGSVARVTPRDVKRAVMLLWMSGFLLLLLFALLWV